MAAEVASVGAGHPAGHPALVTAGGAAALSLFIPGDPIPKGRPRTRVVTPKGGGRPFANIYTDPRTEEYEGHVADCARRQLVELGERDDGQELALPFRGRVLVTLRFFVRRPASYPKSVTLPLKARGDIDNMAKSVLDGLQNAGLFANDRLITDLSCSRRYATEEHPEGVEVDLTGFRDQ